MLSSPWLATAAMLALSFSAGAQRTPQPAPAHDFTVAPGYVVVGSHALASFAAFAPLAGSRTLVFDGDHLDVFDASGGLERRLASLPAFRFPSFVVVDAAQSHAWIGESTLHALYRLDLASGALAQVGTLNNAYAACALAGGDLVLSAATCGFNCGNDLFVLDGATLALAQIGHVPGASGPLACTAQDDVLYGFQANGLPQPGELWIGRWSAQAVAAGGPLTEVGADMLAGGFDGLASLAVDARGGHVFAAESPFAGTARIVELHAQGRRIATVAESGAFLSNVVVEEVGGPGALQPWHPRGMRLHWLETDFSTFPPVAWHRTAEPLRPHAFVETDAGGQRWLVARSGPPGAAVAVAVQRSATFPLPESTQPSAGVLLFAALPVPPASSATLACDAHGELRVAWPLAPSGNRAVQLFFYDAAGRPHASTAPLRD
jgi:hypothetical protein